MPTAEELFRIAEDHAREHGYRFGEGAKQDIQLAMAKAAAEIDALPIDDQQEKLDDIRVNSARLVDAMIAASKTIPGYATSQPGVIGERTLGAALSKICPLWPFC